MRERRLSPHSQPTYERTRPRILEVSATLIAGALTFAAPAAEARLPMQTSAIEPDRKLVVIGASYAGSWGTPSLPGYALTNSGVGGERTGDVLARFDRDVIAARPDGVIIWGHINDIFGAPGGDMRGAAENAKTNLRQMIERARSADIETIVATEVTLSRSRGLRAWVARMVGRLRGKQSYQERVNDQVREVNRFLRGLADQMELVVLDFEQAVDDGSGHRRIEFSAPDGSHITEDGYVHLTAYTRSVLGQRRAGG